MGAALTYARRYALFTLVGIAGEDDVDVPEGLSAAHDAGSVLPDMARPSRDELVRASTPPNRTSPRSIAHQPLPTLKTSESAEMREDLIKALEGISSAEQLTDWVYRQLPMKNRLTIDDARVLEDRFRAR
jgi:hypothetical protein